MTDVTRVPDELAGSITSVKLADFPEVTMTETALLIEGVLPFDRWQALGDVLTFFERSSMWLLGEWAIYGERVYGDKYAQAISAESGYAPESVRVAQWVAEKVPPERRQPDLSWAHHRAVAALEPDEQRTWLERASSEGLSTRELYEQVKGTDSAPVEPSTEPAPASIEEAFRKVLEAYVDADHLDDLIVMLVRAVRSSGWAEA